MNISWFTNKAGILNKDELFKYININRHLLYDFLENQDFPLNLKLEFCNLHNESISNSVFDKIDIKNIDDLLLLIKDLKYTTIESLFANKRFFYAILSDSDTKKIKLLKFLESLYLNQNNTNDVLSRLSIPKLDIKALGIELDLGFKLTFDPYIEMNHQNITYLKMNNNIYSRSFRYIEFSKFESEELIIDFVNHHLKDNEITKLIHLMDIFYEIDDRFYQYVFLNHFDRIQHNILKTSTYLSKFVISNIHDIEIINKFNSLHIHDGLFEYPIHQLTKKISTKSVSIGDISNFMENPMDDMIINIDINNMLLSLLSDDDKQIFVCYLYFMTDLTIIPPYHPLALSINNILSIDSFNIKNIEDSINMKYNIVNYKRIFDLLNIKSFMDFYSILNNTIKYNGIQLE